MKASGLCLFLTALVQSPEAPAQPLVAAQVPAVVSRAFARRFPNVSSVEWKLKADKNYEAEFTLKDAEIAAKFDPAGQWVETESATKHAKVPKAVWKQVSAQFKDYKVVEIQSLERPGEKGLAYELHLENSQEVLKTQWSDKGALLSRLAQPKKGAGK